MKTTMRKRMRLLLTAVALLCGSVAADAQSLVNYYKLDGDNTVYTYSANPLATDADGNGVQMWFDTNDKDQGSNTTYRLAGTAILGDNKAFNTTSRPTDASTTKYIYNAATKVTIPAQVSTDGSTWQTVSFVHLGGSTLLEEVVFKSSFTELKGAYPNVVTTLSTSVQSQRRLPFFYCTALKKVTFNSKITSVGYASFFSCSKLADFEDCSSVTTIGNSAFYEAFVSGTYVDLTGVQTIGNAAFRGARLVGTVPDGNFTVPSSVTSLGESAFENNAFTKVTFAANITKIPAYCFSRCNLLTTFITDDYIDEIGTHAFSECDKFNPIELFGGDNHHLSSLHTIDDFAFCNTGMPATLDLSNTSMQTIGDYAFCIISSAASTALTTISLPASVTSIGKNPFANHARIESITVDAANANYYADETGLYSKDAATKTLVAAIPQYLARNHTGGTFYVPNDVKRIGGAAFGYQYFHLNATESLNYSGLTRYSENPQTFEPRISTVVLPTGLEEIGDFAFANNQLIEELTIPASVTKIGVAAFGSCMHTNTNDNHYYNTSTIKRIYWLGENAMTFVEGDLYLKFNSSRANEYYTHSYYPNTTMYVKKSVKNAGTFDSWAIGDSDNVPTGSKLYDTPKFKAVEWIIPNTNTFAGTRRYATLARDFDVDFNDTDLGNEATIKPAYVAGFNSTTNDITLQEIANRYVPARTGANHDEYHGVMLVVDENETPPAEAWTFNYKIGEQNYYSKGATETNGITYNADAYIVGCPTWTMVPAEETIGDVDYVNHGLTADNFRKYNDTGLKAPYKSFLRVKKSLLPGNGSETKPFTFTILKDDNTTTGIKTINNGQLTIKKSAWFTLDGRRLEARPTQKGIYIHGGKKVVIK